MRNLTPRELAAVAAVDRDRIAADLAALVAIRSLTGEEGEVQSELALRMGTAGLEVERTDHTASDIAADPDFPGIEVARESLPVVSGRISGQPGGRRVLISGHVDVVPAGDELQWSSPPFSPVVRDGRLYGRGACDMKAGVVAGLAALRALVETGGIDDRAGTATLVTVPSEEDGGAGTLAAIRSGHTGDACVITEPTRLQVVTAQAGAITFRMTVTGRAAHAAFRKEGVSALDALWPLLLGLRDDEQRRNRAEKLRVMRDLGLPYPTSIGRVIAGDWPSSVPDRLVAEGRYGVAVGQTVDQAEQELRSAVALACRADPWLSEHPPSIEVTGGRFASAALPAGHPLQWSLGTAARDVLGRLPEFVGVPYGADMRLFVHQGATPTVMFGPGDARLAHAPDEHVDLEEVARCARTLAVWVLRELAS
ncbi:MAG TPA: ArgE/DapE family deacylase [Gaiellales bacterium]|nr:ArgE/DapE family deacylase [Gaiellales bacterium]